MESELTEILASLGGGAAVTTIAWTLLYFMWKRYDTANSSRMTELIDRTSACEMDRIKMREALDEMHEQLFTHGMANQAQVLKALNENSTVLKALTAKLQT